MSVNKLSIKTGLPKETPAAAAASDYMDEVTSKGDVYSERARSVSALLSKISFLE